VREARRGSIANKEEGTVNWLWQRIYSMKTLRASVDVTGKRFSDAFDELIKFRAWEKIPSHQPYGSLDAMLQAELGVSEHRLRREMNPGERVETVEPQPDKSDATKAKRPEGSKGFVHTSDVVTCREPAKPRGNQADYLAGRIKTAAAKGKPAAVQVLAELKAKPDAYPSMHAAAIAAVNLTGIAGVIVGGESGPRRRPMWQAWVASIRDQTVAAGVLFHFKQWGRGHGDPTDRICERRAWDDVPWRTRGGP
jgi:hypothetical protein